MALSSPLEDRSLVPGCREQSLGKQRLVREDVAVSLGSVCRCGDQGLERDLLGRDGPQGPHCPPTH